METAQGREGGRASKGACRVVIASPKGGVGKTTLALNLAHALARRRWRVLLVDSDPQGGIGLSLGGSLTTRAGLADVVLRDASAGDAVLQTREERLSILPRGRLSPVEIADFASAVASGEALDRLFVEVADDSFDLVLVDTPSGFGAVTVGVLRACRSVLMPLQAEPLAGRSLTQMLELLRDLAARGEGSSLLGVVLNMLITRRAESLDVAQESWRLLPEELIFQAAVPRDMQFLEASAAGVPLALLRRVPPPLAAVFDQLAGELEIKLAGELDLEAKDDGEIIPLVD